MNDDTEQTQNPQTQPEASEPPATEPTEAEKLSSELAECKDRYVRAVAELDNMRRRFEREKSELLKFGQEKLFLDFLPALDGLDRALPDEQAQPETSSDQAGDSYLQGVRMVKRQILDVFKKHGLEPIEVKGLPFDPNLHQAIQRIDSTEVSIDTVRDEYAKGYLLHGRLLRPAMVSVLTPSAST